MRDLAHIFQLVGFWLYALPILWCAGTLLVKREVHANIGTLRRFQTLGPLLGLSLGGCIFGAIVGTWMDHGEFSMDWSSQEGRLEAAALISFFAVWVSNIKLEIWTLEPVRKLDNRVPDLPERSEAFEQAVGSLRLHLALHSLGIISVIVLSSSL